MELIRIRQLLPGIFRRTLREGTPLFALLKVMETLHAPSAAVLHHLDEVFNPRRTRSDFVPFLAQWLDLHNVLIDSPVEQRGDPERLWSRIERGRLRELVANAADLSGWRGTARGLRKFLEIATGESGFEIEEQVKDTDGVIRPFHFRIKVPKTLTNRIRLIEHIIQSEKPAYVTFEIELN